MQPTKKKKKKKKKNGGGTNERGRQRRRHHRRNKGIDLQGQISHLDTYYGARSKRMMLMDLRDLGGAEMEMGVIAPRNLQHERK